MSAENEEGTAAVVVGDEEFLVAPDKPFVFGRAQAPGCVGLDPNDLGISAEAGSVECTGGVWWVVNRSSKRPLLFEHDFGQPPQRLGPGRRQLITIRRSAVLVPGAVYTHRLEVVLPEGALASFRVETRPGTDTVTLGDVRLSERDRDALTALFSGYLRPFPWRDPRPLTYRQGAALLGPPWTKTTLRRQVDRIKERLGRAGVYVDGPRANDELAEHLINNGILSSADLGRLRVEAEP